MNHILYNALKSDNIPNLLLYGIKNSGKKTQLFQILQELYSPSANIYKISNEIEYSYNDIYYIFDIQSIQTKNYPSFLKIITEIIHSKNHFGKISNKLIIFQNFQNIKSTIQNSLRVLIEKYRNTTVFLLISNKFNSIHQPIQSRCLCIRLSPLKRKEKREIIHPPLKRKECSIKFYDLIYEVNNQNDIQLLKQCKEIIEHKEYFDPYDKIIHRLMVIIKKGNYSKEIHTKIREIAYNIEKFNLIIPELYQKFMVTILQDHSIRDNTKYKLIQFFADSEYDYQKSYRSLIVVELFLFKLFEIINS